MKKTTLLTAALLSLTISLTARDFDVVSPSGHTLYCDIVQGGAAIVGIELSSQDTGPIHLVIPSRVSNEGYNLNVVAIGDSAFMYCHRMVSVEIPSSVRRIGREAFHFCRALGSVAIPSSVDSIGEDAFYSALNVEYTGTAQGAPWGAKYLNSYHEGQYYYSDSLKTHIVCCERDATDATIPSSVTTIGYRAFHYCTGITSLRIDSTISQVGANAFANCTGLDSVYFNPQSSDYNTFSDCTGLRHITIGNALSVLQNNFCTNCTSLKEIVIPDNITDAGTDAFSGCTSLQSAVVGSGITYLKYSLFEGCTSLKDVELSESLQEINGSAFRNCTSLRQIILPESIISIGDRAFSGCSSMERIVCMSSSVPHTADRAFDSIDQRIEVIVRCNKERQFEQDAVWQRFENIQGQSYYVLAHTNNPNWGQAIVTEQPTCYSNTATVEALPEEGCRFVKWANGSTDNPRQLTSDAEGYFRLRAIFEPTVGISETEMLHDVKVYFSGRNIIIQGAQGEQVQLFDIMGRLLFSSQIPTTTFQIPIPASISGICLVKVGNRKADKIIIGNF